MTPLGPMGAQYGFARVADWWEEVYRDVLAQKGALKVASSG